MHLLNDTSIGSQESCLLQIPARAVNGSDPCVGLPLTNQERVKISLHIQSDSSVHADRQVQALFMVCNKARSIGFASFTGPFFPGL